MNIYIPSKMVKAFEVAKPLTISNPRPKKHTSVILRKGSIVSLGTNINRTHPKAKEYGYLFDEVHSELDALLKYRGPKDKLILVNFRFNGHGIMRSSKPCPKCMMWCDAIFDQIWYTTDSGLKLLGEEICLNPETL